MRTMSKETDICGICQKRPRYAEYVKRNLGVWNMSKEIEICGICQKRPTCTEYANRDPGMRYMSKETEICGIYQKRPGHSSRIYEKNQTYGEYFKRVL